MRKGLGVFVVAAALSSVAGSAVAPRGLMPGEPLDPTLLRHDSKQSPNDKVALGLNNKKDRVVGEFTNCELGRRTPAPESCDRVRFAFPELAVDLASKNVLLGKDVVGKIGGLSGVQLENGYQLRLDKTKTVIRRDAGRDYTGKVEVRVALFIEKM